MIGGHDPDEFIRAAAAAQLKTPWAAKRGRCSHFGGPLDRDLRPHEGLALYPLARYPLGMEFLFRPGCKAGFAASLDPRTHYCAMRWDYKKTPAETLRRAIVKVEHAGLVAWAHPVDWGPAASTGRIIDLSPGAMAAVRAKTDSLVDVTLILP